MTTPPSPHRPVYHFTTDLWMNDPIPWYVGGAYHVFYQHNPNAAYWGDMHWGHAVSRDLVRWDRRPIALAPTPGGPDADGVWTGCLTRDEAGRTVALYTAIPTLKPFVQVQALASADDPETLERWSKWDGNPIVAPKPDGYGECFRDPQTFETGDGARYLVIGGELPERRGGTAFVYRAESGDLTRWQYLHPLCEGKTEETGHDFECPDLFPLGDSGGDRWLLLSSREKTWWHAGTLTPDVRLTVDAHGPCDTGAFYAGKTIADGRGRRILFGWVREGRPTEASVAEGWSGALALPRVVTAGPDGRPRFDPVPEVEALRGAHTTLETRVTGAETDLCTASDTAEIALAFGPTSGETVVTLYVGEDAVPCRYTLPPTPTRLRWFCDRSVIELYPDGGTPHTFRAYPERPGAVRLTARTTGDPVTVQSEAWELAV
jgi:beta-fructofuranosidase